MTEIEMEVDMKKPGAMEHHRDDDLIDYDTDMEDENGPTLQINDNSAVEVTHVDEIEIDVDNVENHIDQEADAEMSEEPDLIGAEETMQDVDQVVGDVQDTFGHEHSAMEDHNEEPVEIPQAGDNDHVEISHGLEPSVPNSHGVDHLTGDGHGLENEIDYELEDNTDKAQENEIRGDDDSIPAEVPATIKSATQPEGPETLGEELNAKPEDTLTEHADQKTVEEEVEITYEEDDHAPEETLALVETAHIGSSETVLNDKLDESHPEGEVDGGKEQEPAEYPNEEPEDPTTIQNEGDYHVGLDEYDVTTDVAEEPTDEQVTHASEHGYAPSAHDSIVASENEFPAIVVQYNNEEFPLFSHDQNGFFTDDHLLDETMDKLLSGLRDELRYEIPGDHEVVFHVDELGLQFAESSSHDFLTSVTLRQILEIFELLVRNQDPDKVSQTLFTYVFTKRCPTKRLEFLIESATAGKGLGEVSHHFESGSPPPTIPSLWGEFDVNAQHDANDGEDLDPSTLSHDDGNGVEDDKENGDQSDSGCPEKDDVEHSVEDEVPVQGAASAPEEQEQENADYEDESDPFKDLELEPEEEQDEVGVGAKSAADEQNQADRNEEYVDVANTSTTTTLRADDDTGSITGEMASVKVNTILLTEHEDELEEIDWRDESEIHNAPTPPSATGKRARADDDEVDAEDEQDVKRRRPSTHAV